jgi:hypothetical protein
MMRSTVLSSPVQVVSRPPQKASIERSHRTVRYDGRDQFRFTALSKVQEFATRWLWTDNPKRPNMALVRPWEAYRQIDVGPRGLTATADIR